MLKQIAQFQKDAQALGLNGSSVEDFKLWFTAQDNKKMAKGISYDGVEDIGTITLDLPLTVTAKVSEVLYIDKETKEPVDALQYELQYDTKVITAEILKHVSKAVQDMTGNMIVGSGGDVLIGFPNVLKTDKYDGYFR